jgi:Na+/H+ antiporter NhaD/arsenite permease-like protein
MPTEAVATAVFVMTYLAMALGHIPGLKLDRAGAALAGAAGMVACGALSLEEAYRAIDLNTLTLLLGMMIVVAHLRLSGFFATVGAWAAVRARHPLVLLAAIVLVSGSFSAFLVNDTVCIVLTPLVCELAARLKRDPIAYLLAVAMASNAGSTATITGNPQNIIIGSLSRIPYTQFAATLAPVAAIGLLLTFGLLALVFRHEFWTRERLSSTPSPAEFPSAAPSRLVKPVLVTLAMMAGFFAGLPPAAVAISAAAVMLITRRVTSSETYAQIDWPLLAMFAGLFIVVAGMEKWLFSAGAQAVIGALHLERISVLSALTALLSNVVSNVPAVLVLKPFVSSLHDPRRAWLALAMSSTLAGNLTLVGSIANLIVARGAEAHGIKIRFWTYLKVGVPLTVLTLLVGVLWL